MAFQKIFKQMKKNKSNNSISRETTWNYNKEVEEIIYHSLPSKRERNTKFWLVNQLYISQLITSKSQNERVTFQKDLGFYFP